MNVLFIMDPLSAIHPQKDTTYLLIKEAMSRRLAAFFCECDDLVYRDGRVSARCQEIKKWGAEAQRPDRLQAQLGETAHRSLADFALVFMRTDPPVDFRYLTATYLLTLAGAQTRVINNPDMLRGLNEKLFTLDFAEFCPESLLSCDGGEIRDFIKKLGGKGVIKPLYRRGGEGVFVAALEDPNFSSIVEAATAGGRETVIAQRFIPESRLGDKRIVLVNGEPLGAVLRVSQSGDFRNNLHLGGRGEKTKLTPREQTVCKTLGPELRKKGLFLVGLDMLGDYLTEINFTSPTGYQEINTLDGLTEGDTLEAKTFAILLDAKKA